MILKAVLLGLLFLAALGKTPEIANLTNSMTGRIVGVFAIILLANVSLLDGILGLLVYISLIHEVNVEGFHGAGAVKDMKKKVKDQLKKKPVEVTTSSERLTAEKKMRPKTYN